MRSAEQTSVHRSRLRRWITRGPNRCRSSGEGIVPSSMRRQPAGIPSGRAGGGGDMQEGACVPDGTESVGGAVSGTDRVLGRSVNRLAVRRGRVVRPAGAGRSRRAGRVRGRMGPCLFCADCRPAGGQGPGGTVEVVVRGARRTMRRGFTPCFPALPRNP